MLFSSHHRRRPSVTWTARTIIRRAALQRSAVAYYSVTSRCSTVHDCLYAMPDAATPMLPAFFACRPCYVLFLRPRRGSAEYCDERVCLCVFVCLSAIISPKLHVRSSPIFVHVSYGCGSVLLLSYVFPVLWMTSYLHIS